MLTKRKITVISVLSLAVIFLLVFFSQQAVAASSDVYYGTNDIVESGARLFNADLRTLVANIINIFLGLLGVIAVVIILYGGFRWMTSGGAPQKIDEAKRIIVNGAIGLAIILAAYGIVRLIFAIATGEFSPGGGGPGGGSGYGGGRGLGAGALESHYPARNARGVPRNTNIYVTFKENMNVSFIVADPACSSDCQSNGTNIRLIDLNNGVTLDANDLRVSYDPANPRTFEFNPYGSSATHLGVDNQNVAYQMVLDGLETESGRAAFPVTGFYDWSFTVSTELDLTPPTVTYVLPVDASIDNPRNATVQINFSEAVIPSGPNGASGRYEPPVNLFNNIVVSDAGGSALIGSYLISNQYRTVEFSTDELCGLNSCGGEVYCLPALQSISVLVKGDDADLGMIRDMAGNSLDGDGDGNAGGDYSWSFSTNDAVDLSAPLVISMSPDNNFPLTDPVEIEFSKNLLSSSVNSDNISIYEVALGDVNYWMSLSDPRTVYIHHDRFKPLTDYHPALTSDIRDVLQNCWYPCICDDPGGSCSCDTDPRPACAAGTHCEEP